MDPSAVHHNVKKSNWIIQIYIVIYLIIGIGYLLAHFLPGSAPFRYYQTLMAFHIGSIVIYITTVLSAYLNLLAFVPMFCHVYRRDFLSKHFWKVFLVLRVVLDFSCHQYEALFIRSLFYLNNTLAVILVLNILFLIILPSYILCYIYAFGKNLQPKLK